MTVHWGKLFTPSVLCFLRSRMSRRARTLEGRGESASGQCVKWFQQSVLRRCSINTAHYYYKGATRIPILQINNPTLASWGGPSKVLLALVCRQAALDWVKNQCYFYDTRLCTNFYTVKHAGTSSCYPEQTLQFPCSSCWGTGTARVCPNRSLVFHLLEYPYLSRPFLHKSWNSQNPLWPQQTPSSSQGADPHTTLTWTLRTDASRFPGVWYRVPWTSAQNQGCRIGAGCKVDLVLCLLFLPCPPSFCSSFFFSFFLTFEK